MKLRFKQRMFSLLDSYDVFDENGDTVYKVAGRWSLTHKFSIQDPDGQELGMVRQCLFSFLPKFELMEDGENIGTVQRKLTFFDAEYEMDGLDWYAEGDIFGWDYSIYDSDGNRIADISKELWNMMDTYTLDIENSLNALYVLMFVLAIDAEKCSARN